MSLAEALRLLRASGLHVLLRLAFFVVFAALGWISVAVMETTGRALLSGEAGRLLGFGLALLALAVLVVLVDALPLGFLIWGGLLVMVRVARAPGAPAPDFAQVRSALAASGQIRRLRRLLGRTLGDVVRLVQGLAAVVPSPLNKGTVGRLWIRATGRCLADIALACVLDAPAERRGAVAQATTVRIADTTRSLVRLALAPVALAWALTAFSFAAFAAVAWHMRAVGADPAGGVVALALAGYLAWLAHRALAEPLLAALLLPKGLTIIGEGPPNPHWSARLEASSRAWTALRPDTASGGSASRRVGVPGGVRAP